ncbi:MAG: hypothetical protein QXR88_01660 [Candidatus Pacearchaeota archaeon]
MKSKSKKYMEETNNKQEKITVKELLKLYLDNNSALIEMKTLVEIFKKEMENLHQNLLLINNKLDKLEEDFYIYKENVKLFKKLFFTFTIGTLLILTINLVFLLIKK